MMQFLKTKDREAVSAIYDAGVKVMIREGIVEEKVLQSVIDEASAPPASRKKFGPQSFSISVSCARRGSN